MDEHIARQVTRNIMPLLGISFFVSILDRVNVGFASLTMNADIGLSAAAYGFGAGIFFLGYFAFEIPSNLILQKVGARRWIARIMVTWGLLSMGMALVQGPYSFYAIRFLLGLAEAGFVPGVVYYMNQWYTKREIGRATAIFFAFGPIANAVGAPLSTALIGAFDWRWMFVIEGIPAIILGIIVFLRLPDRIEDAKFLNNSQKSVLRAQLQAEGNSDAKHASPLSALMDLPTLALAFQYFLILTTGYALNMWLPQIVRELGVPTSMVGWVVAVPYVAAALSIYFWSRYTKYTDDRLFYVLIPCALGALGFVIGALTTNPLISMFAFCCVAAGIYAGGSAYWALPRPAVSGAAAAAAIALANSLGNLGGFTGPYLFGIIRDTTGNYEYALFAASAFLLSGGLMSFVNIRLAWQREALFVTAH